MTYGIVSLGIASAVAFAGAAFLAYHDKDGWGWLIFADIMIGATIDNFAK